jgi:hypothetical protein
VRAYADPAGLDQISANAASHGHKVWFADRDPSLRTVAHELAHVRQAGGLAMSSSMPRQIGASDSALEREADAFATAVVHGGGLPEIAARSDGGTLHLDPKKKITKIDVTFEKSDGHGNGVGKATVVVHYDDNTTKTMHGDGGGKKDTKGIHPTSGGQHEIDAANKDADHHSSVYKGPDNKPAPMKYYTPFAPGEGFHVGNVNDMSHGCIHMTEGDAKEIFDNAGDHVPVDIHVPKAPAKKAPAQKAPAQKAPAKKPPAKKPPAKKPPAKKPPAKKKTEN